MPGEENHHGPTTIFCPNLACPARGHIGQDNFRISSHADQRFLGMECHKTCNAAPGKPFYRLHTVAETVSLVVTLMVHPLRHVGMTTI